MAQSTFAATPTEDLGARDTLRLSEARIVIGEFRVDIQVHNDQELAAMDIPLRFGQPGDPITLDTVEWSARVDGWYLRHAAIDNERKTVILGLIAEIGGEGAERPLAVLADGDPRVATLVFRIQGDLRPSITTFTTENPGHALTFIYNRYKHGRPYVEEFTPEFVVGSGEE